MKPLINSFFQLDNFLALGLVLIFNVFASNAQELSGELFSQGNKAYNDGDYGKAITLYEQILNDGKHISELYYNLGNAYYRLNQVAESIYFFEKAKQLAPENQDIQINSSFAQNMTLDAIEPLPESQLAQIQKRVFELFSTDMWSKLTLLLLWLSALLFLGYLFNQTTRLKRAYFFLSLVLFLFFMGSFLITFFKDSTSQQTQYAILFSKQIDTWSEPNQQGDLLFVLHEGTKLQLLDSLAEWQKIRIANGSEGWLLNADLRNLNK